MELDELAKLSADFVKLQKDFKVIKASSTSAPVTPDEMYRCMDNMHRHITASLNNIHDRINHLHQRHSDHQEGHLPPMKSPSQMEAALKSLGLHNDYSVHKPVVHVGSSYAYASTKGKLLEISYEKKKDEKV